MKVTLESTTRTLELVVNGHRVPARVWEGTTAAGIHVHAYITRIAVRADQDAREFEAELQETRAPSPEVAELPARLVL